MKYTDMVQGYKYRIDGTNTIVICTQGKNIIPGQKEIPPSEYKIYNMDFECIQTGVTDEEVICQGFMTGEDLLQIVIDYMKKNPDNVYGKFHPDSRSCFYTKGECSNGSVGCVFGQVLSMLGFNMAQFDDSSSSPDILVVCNKLGIYSNTDTQGKLKQIQITQDRLRSWGECIQGI